MTILTPNPPLLDGEKLVPLLNQRLHVIQHPDGYAVSIDALILAHACRHLAGPLLDLGTASGVIAMALDQLGRATPITGVDIQPTLIDRARRTWFALPEKRTSITWVCDDARTWVTPERKHTLRTLVCNPPFFKIGHGHPNPNRERYLARHEETLTLTDLARIAQHLLAPRGTLALILPATRLAEACHTLTQRHLTPTTLQMVHPTPAQPARLVWIHAIHRGQQPLQVQSPLWIRLNTATNNAHQTYSPAMQAVLSGVW